MHRPKKRMDEMGMDLFNDVAVEDELKKGTGPKQFRYKKLAAATGNFADGRKLGEGGFRSVYKGFFKDLNLDVAIKRVSKSSKQGMKEYVLELRTISRLRHRNLAMVAASSFWSTSCCPVAVSTLTFTIQKMCWHGRSCIYSWRADLLGSLDTFIQI